MRTGRLIILPITGIIISGASQQAMPLPFLPFSQGNATFSEDVIEVLKKIKSSRKVKAVLFQIDSPGGTPYASKVIADEIKKLEIVSVAQIKEHGTSGAYWVASSCDRIIADELSYIGGIGTRAERLDFSELAKKIGIRVDTFFKGEYKGMGSPYTEPSEKEKSFIEEQVSAFNEYFIKAIKENRDIKDNKVLENITSGRPYLGRQALELGLIDDLGREELAIEKAEELSKVGLRPVYLRIGRSRQSFAAKLIKRFF
jgi:protease IV